MLSNMHFNIHDNNNDNDKDYYYDHVHYHYNYYYYCSASALQQILLQPQLLLQQLQQLSLVFYSLMETRNLLEVLQYM